MKKSPAKRALDAAMRKIPMQGDGELYRGRLLDYQAGWLAGWNARCKGWKSPRSANEP